MEAAPIRSLGWARTRDPRPQSAAANFPPPMTATRPPNPAAKGPDTPLVSASATPAGSVSILIIAWTANRWVSDDVTIGIDDIGEAVAAFIAAGSCGFAAWRNSGRVRMAWALLGLSALSWAVGEVIWSWNEVIQGEAVPFPSSADGAYLLAIPLAIAGVFAFTSAPTRLATRGETV